jgi:hypothetical protein
MMLTSNASPAQTSCLDDLLASVIAATDVSACNLLTLTDGRVLAVKTEHGLFVQTKAGLNATHCFIDAKRMKIEASHFKRSNSFPPMDRALPDAKQHYYTFYGLQRSGSMRRAPKDIKFVCQRPDAFSASSEENCPR